MPHQFSNDLSYPLLFCLIQIYWCPHFRSHWPRSLSHEVSSPARTLRSWVRIPLKAWMCLHLLCAYVVLSGWRSCDGLIRHPRSPSDCLKIKKQKWNKAFHGCPMLKSGSNNKEIEIEISPLEWVTWVLCPWMSRVIQKMWEWMTSVASWSIRGRHLILVMSIRYWLSGLRWLGQKSNILL
jgi:hypothetical protein